MFAARCITLYKVTSDLAELFEFFFFIVQTISHIDTILYLLCITYYAYSNQLLSTYQPYEAHIERSITSHMY